MPNESLKRHWLIMKRPLEENKGGAESEVENFSKSLFNPLLRGQTQRRISNVEQGMSKDEGEAAGSYTDALQGRSIDFLSFFCCILHPSSVPLVLGTPVIRGSASTAIRSARADALKTASAMWWLLRP